MNIVNGLVYVFHLIGQWYLTVPREKEGAFDDALVATASVAAVIWTGGLITMQLRKQSGVLTYGLDLLQNAFMGPLLALFVIGVPLRTVILLFCLYYAYFAIRQLVALSSTSRNIPGVLVFTQPERKPMLKAVYLRINVEYQVLTLIALLFYLPVIMWPTQRNVCICTWCAMFLGMQLILTRLYGVSASARALYLVFVITFAVMIFLLSSVPYPPLPAP